MSTTLTPSGRDPTVCADVSNGASWQGS
ncbi:MAG: hypothetical protein J07HX5_00569, partial [halophilic archaeon J07HX5]